MDGLAFAWPMLVITIILLGAVIHSLVNDEWPRLRRPEGDNNYEGKH